MIKPLLFTAENKRAQSLRRGISAQTHVFPRLCGEKKSPSITTSIMKKIFLYSFIALIISTPSFSQSDEITQTIAVFPYQHKTDADAAITKMQTWNKSAWSSLFSMLDDDSLKLKASYALSAYVHDAATDAQKKARATTNLLPGLSSTKSYYAKELIIKYFGALGDDAAVKPLSKLLDDESLIDNAARALAAIHSEKAIAVLKNASAKNPTNKFIKAAIDNVSKPLPVIKQQLASQKATDNFVQQLLYLQDKMESAKEPIQKKRILSDAARIPGFSSFIFVSHYVSDPELSKDAALITTRLALADKEIRGPIVREALEKALPLLKGEDSAILARKLLMFLKTMPYDNGFVSLFNGKDLSGWKALVGNPISRSKMTEKELADAQNKANEKTKGDWIVKDGLLIFTGHGDNLATDKMYGNIEMYVDWKITEKGDAGIYLRGSPQVQIWDTSRRESGAQVGSGGLYNNQVNASKPLLVADNKIGQWNRFHIIMKGDKVTVWLNGKLVTDTVVLENYWDRKLPIFPKEQMELQAHGTYVAYRNIYLRELPTDNVSVLSEDEKKQGFTMLYDGTHMNNWIGNKEGYLSEEGAITVHPELKGGNLYTKDEYADFIYRFEFQLTPGANNGIGIRAPLEGDAAYVGMEIQVLDSEAEIYKNLQPYQYHGSVYGVIPAKRGFLKPLGEWNTEEIVAKGNKIKVTLNGVVIVDGDIKEAGGNGTMDHKEHPGLFNKSGHIGFLGHGDVVRFRNIRVTRL